MGPPELTPFASWWPSRHPLSQILKPPVQHSFIVMSSLSTHIPNISCATGTSSFPIAIDFKCVGQRVAPRAVFLLLNFHRDRVIHGEYHPRGFSLSFALHHWQHSNPDANSTAFSFGPRTPIRAVASLTAADILTDANLVARYVS